MLTTEVENYPGFVEGIMGPELMEQFRGQAARFGADLRHPQGHQGRPFGSPFSVWTSASPDAEPDYIARALIVATGARSLMLDVPGEARLLGHGVSTCATCDGFFFRDQDDRRRRRRGLGPRRGDLPDPVRPKVTLIHRRKELRASKIMQDRAFVQPEDRLPVGLGRHRSARRRQGDRGCQVRNVVSGDESTVELGGLFVAIGHVPNTAVFAGQLDLADAGYIVTHHGTHTNVDGVFACGDVQDHIYRQAITAAGSGCMAAIDAERWLEALED